MISDQVQKVLHKRDQGKELTTEEKRILYNYEYRHTKEGKKRKEIAKQNHKNNYQQFNLSFPRDRLNDLKQFLGQKPTGKVITNYLLEVLDIDTLRSKDTEILEQPKI